MYNMSRAFVTFLLCCLWITSVEAVPLIKEDDSVIIYDTNTHWQWLMLTESNWMNYSQQEALRDSYAGGGWLWASGEQVATVAGYYGIDLGFSGTFVDIDMHPSDDDAEAITAFAAMFGDTVGEDGAIIDPNNAYLGVLGRIASPAPLVSNHVMGAYLFDNDSYVDGWETANYYAENSGQISPNNFRPAYGAWLYRPIPSPATLGLVLLGLVPLWLGRRRGAPA
jgi:hypothetical protein